MNLDIFDDEIIEKVSKSTVEVKNINTRDIAIIGISGKLPMCESFDGYWNNIINNAECIKTFPKERKKDIEKYLKFKGMKDEEFKYFNAAFLDEIDEFDPKEFHLSPKEANLMDPKQRLFLENARNVIEDAGYNVDELKGKRIGVYAGASDSVNYTYFDIIKDIESSSIDVGLTGNLNSIIPSRVSYLFDFKGPSVTLDTACSSSLVAIHVACKALRENECDAAIVGGVRLHMFPLENGYRMGFESKDGRTKAFDDGSTGTGIGEGAISIMLKPLYKAQASGDHIYAIVKGSAINQDGNSVGITAPNSDSQADVIEQAWKDAGVSPEDISYIETHGTGTILGDPVEIDGICKAFSKYTSKKQFCGIGSVKNNIGHLFDVAGLASLIKCIYALNSKKIPPTININLPNKLIDFVNSPVYISDSIKDWNEINGKRLCGISSFGISGTNCHIVLEQFPQEYSESQGASILVLSAKSSDVLRKLINKYLNDFEEIRKNNPKDVEYTALIGRRHYKNRIAIIFNNFDELANALKILSNNEFEKIKDKNIYYNCISESIEESDSYVKELYDINLNVCEERKKYEQIAEAYINDVNINWRKLFESSRRKRVKLPSEVFEKRKYWVEISDSILNQKNPKDIISDTKVYSEAILEGRTNGEYTETERKLSMIIKKILGYDMININDNFYEFGGDSILMTKLHCEINELFKIEISIADIYSYPTIKQLSKCIDELFGDKKTTNKIVVSKDSIDDDIAVIGMAGRFPLADNIDEYWKNICSSKNCITNIPANRRRDLKNYLYQLGYNEENVKFAEGGYLKEIDKFDYEYFGISLEEATLMDPNQKGFIEVVFEMLENSGYGGERLKGSNTGVFVGYTDDFVCNLRRFIFDSDPSLVKNALAGNLASVIPGRISYLLDLRGPSIVVDSACSSSLVAVNSAIKSLRSGECESAIVGSSNIKLVPIDDQESKVGIESNSCLVRTFDESADGTIEGEAICAVMLKPLNKAIADGDNIRAIIKGSAVNQDGMGLGVMAPRAETQTEVILKAWEDAAIDPTTISYIETHGTGTKLGDPIEIEGLRKAFEKYTNRKQFCAIASVKTNIGHVYQASGIASLIKTILSLENRIIPPMINFNRPNRLIAFENSPFYVNDVLREWEVECAPRRCGVSSFGLSGTNAHVIIEEYEKEDTIKQTYGKHVFTLSGKTNGAIEKIIENYYDFLLENRNLDFDYLCYTSNIGRGHYNIRIAIIANSQNELMEKLSKLKNGVWNKGIVENVFYGELYSRKSIYCDIKDSDDLLIKNCISYIEGNDIEWRKLYAENMRKVISLPVYPFEKIKCWFQPKLRKKRTTAYITEETIFDGREDNTSESNIIVSEKEIAMVNLNNYEAPTNKLEHDMVEIWEEILNIKSIGINHNFFELGGDSVSAIKMEVEMEKRGIETKDSIASSIYKYPTIKELLLMRKDIDYVTL